MGWVAPRPSYFLTSRGPVTEEHPLGPSPISELTFETVPKLPPAGAQFIFVTYRNRGKSSRAALSALSESDGCCWRGGCGKAQPLCRRRDVGRYATNTWQSARRPSIEPHWSGAPSLQKMIVCACTVITAPHSRRSGHFRVGAAHRDTVLVTAAKMRWPAAFTDASNVLAEVHVSQI